MVYRDHNQPYNQLWFVPVIQIPGTRYQPPDGVWLTDLLLSSVTGFDGRSLHLLDACLDMIDGCLDRKRGWTLE